MGERVDMLREKYASVAVDGEKWGIFCNWVEGVFN